MTATYDPTKVRASFGPVILSGFAEGEMIKDEPQGDGVKVETGTAGEVAFVETPNRHRNVTARLMETSVVNAELSALFNVGNPPLPFAIESESTGALLVGGTAKIERIPGTSYAAGVPVREWTFLIPKATVGIAGSV